MPWVLDDDVALRERRSDVQSFVSRWSRLPTKARTTKGALRRMPWPSIARSNRSTTTADLLAAVRAAGGWLPYVDAPRKELLALRQRLPALRDRGRAAPSSSVRAHERLFLDTPDDVFTSVLAFWRSDRDSRY